jgi:hypothetical protein
MRPAGLAGVEQSTAQLNEELLEIPEGSGDIRDEQFITGAIGRFRKKVFAWRPGMREPSFEDHFTQIDMALKSGHNLGPDYDSAKLRAIHNLTVHRIFSWLRRPKRPFPDDAACRPLGAADPNVRGNDHHDQLGYPRRVDFRGADAVHIV